MIYDADNNPRYADKSYDPAKARTISVELRNLLAEMEANPNYHISRECSFYPRGFPRSSPGWSVGC